MKVLYTIVLLLTSLVASADQGSGGADFVNIFHKYCYAFKDRNAASAEKNLERSGKFRNPQFEDAYEIFVGSVDYAVTPQNHDCTTDVLLKRNGRVLFSQSQIMSQLIKLYGLKETNRRIFQDVALNNRNTKIQQTDFIGNTGHSYRMLYPLNNQDSYYMTFTIDW
mgnify:FL=1